MAISTRPNPVARCYQSQAGLAVQYFALTDVVDLSGLQWQRGGYRLDELDRVYTGNDVRATLVIDKVSAILLDPHKARDPWFLCKRGTCRLHGGQI